jgi:hypothetical protein
MGSNPVRVTFWRISSVGRASALQAEGHRFEPCILHRSPLVASLHQDGSVAQLVEQWIEAPCVGGSIPSCAIDGGVAKSG